MSPRIRQATPADVRLILELIRELAEYEKLLDQCISTEDDLHRALFGARPYAEVILAFIGDEPAGFALFFHNFSTFLGKPGIYLEDLYVKQHLRGLGVGYALLQYLASIALERGCGRMEWSVLDWNTPALNFYERIGANILRDWQICRMTGEGLKRLARAEEEAKSGTPSS